MNTYTITGNSYYKSTWTVEAKNEEDAIHEVEWGNVEPEESELDYSDGYEVVETEFGETEYKAALTLEFVVRGSEDDPKDALWDILAGFDGKTTPCEDGELELIGFNIEHVEER